jgi:hypothetical protein
MEIDPSRGEDGQKVDKKVTNEITSEDEER